MVFVRRSRRVEERRPRAREPEPRRVGPRGLVRRETGAGVRGVAVVVPEKLRVVRAEVLLARRDARSPVVPSKQMELAREVHAREAEPVRRPDTRPELRFGERFERSLAAVRAGPARTARRSARRARERVRGQFPGLQSRAAARVGPREERGLAPQLFGQISEQRRVRLHVVVEFVHRPELERAVVAARRDAPRVRRMRGD
mmetsp:Transcript_7932/g.24200  ORF Transcript_7932/g.24200 Transcript_7932/m.24200 type:complete len:201 (-) Transcript_7932:1356-1958(-)